MNILKMPADLPEAILNPNAEVVLQKRYLKKGLPSGKRNTRQAILGEAPSPPDVHLGNDVPKK